MKSCRESLALWADRQAVAFAYGILPAFAATVGVALTWADGLGGAVQTLLLVNALAAFVFWGLAEGKA